jgi:membrane-bound lytic murein transglycosylase B
VVELDRRQPEFTMTFDEYLGKIASPTRARIAAKMLVEHDEILTKVSKKYGVQKRYIVTFWGVETNFGQYLGSFNVPHALATLAFDGRRSAYFRKELLNALKILEEGHITPEKMKGSWAGAMGQSQFMPSSFLSYAVDWDGDGKRDIWGTKADVFASTAYYLSKAGWRDDITWGRKVKLPKGFSMNGKSAKALADGKTRAKLPVWAKLGVLNADGGALPTKNLTARLVMPAGSDGPAFLVYSNFDSILDWNRSNYYALAIGHLSDKLR